jgi:uncharacterized protein
MTVTRGNSMEKLSQDLKSAITKIKPAMVATANSVGQPNVSPKGSLRVLDDQHLVFAEIRSPETIKNLWENPQIAIIGFDPSSGKGWRIWGKMEEILNSGDLYEKYCSEYASKGKVNYVVTIIVEKGIVF